MAEQQIDDIAQRHGVSVDAALHLLEALVRGHGAMAQFQHPELGGGGQWMKGGMTMVGDMFDHRLKARVDALCTELAPIAIERARAATTDRWWKADLGEPSSTGAQNQTRYAYFPASRRLAVEVNGRVTIYDTLDHRIGGFSQQQSGGPSATFSSQHGPIDMASLPIVSGGSAVGAIAAAPAEGDAIATIERLAALHAKGILTDEEFAAKKTELLRRL